jgi:PelA/Pel-15E family pectate lyase
MRISGFLCIICTVFVLENASLAADPNAKPAPEKQVNWRQASGSRPVEWYKSSEARRVADNLLLYQGTCGGWDKNIDMAKALNEDETARLIATKDRPRTLDNGATHTQLRYLANVYAATGDARYYDSFMKGIQYLLTSQYPNGGWPQYYPAKQGYSTHITFNDGAMLGAMRVLDGIARGIKPFDVVKDEALKAKCKAAVQNGVDCILKCQVVVDGKKTAWCQQHDEVTFKPVGARAFELSSLTASESTGLVRFLMDIDKPSPQIIDSIESCIRWLEQVKIMGVQEKYVPDAFWDTGWNKVHIKDPNAGPIWARFYEMGTNKAMYVDRDGVPVYDISEIGYERRNGYAWTGRWPLLVLGDKYTEWKKKLTSGGDMPAKK